jgi:hypothetical protein
VAGSTALHATKGIEVGTLMPRARSPARSGRVPSALASCRTVVRHPGRAAIRRRSSSPPPRRAGASIQLRLSSSTLRLYASEDVHYPGRGRAQGVI